MEPVVVKISGNVVDDHEALNAVLLWVRHQSEAGVPVVLVHGGGRQLNDYSAHMGMEAVMIEGRRVTDAATLELVVAVLGGLVNKSIVAHCRTIGLSSCGITGIDGNMTTSHKRPPLQIQNELVDFGYVGQIDSVDVSLVQHLLAANIVPVIGCLTWSEHDGMLNINADTFSNKIASALKASSMYAIMDVEAVLDKNKHPLASISHHDFHRGVQEGWIAAGMVPKLSNAFKAIDSGVEKVVLTNAKGLLSGSGTVVSSRVVE
jgi:acetylglutamate kinase